ncbi:MAG: translation initiation factor IF-3 [Oligoflexales bacterium]
MEIVDRARAQQLDKVRLVGESQNEIIQIQDAMSRARDMGLDLVLISADVKPPVVRIQDLKKVEYERKKARKIGRHVSTMKEIQFKVNISDHDLSTKISRIEKFLERGDKVKVLVRLKGRERENPDRAVALVEKVAESVECKMSRVAGHMVTAILEPVKAAVKS